MKKTVSVPHWDEMVNDTFVPLMEDRSRYLILYGGRGSGKSIAAAVKIIIRCLSEKYFRCVMIRKTYATIKDSSYQTIKDLVHEYGLDSLFHFKQNPLEIRCWNGNLVVARGLDDTTKIKSIKDFNCAWWEEDLPEEDEHITVSSSIRTPKGDYLQELFSINPEVEGNYQDHWFYKKYFEGRAEKTFKGIIEDEDDDGNVIRVDYSVHHSDYKDNPHLPAEFGLQLRKLKQSNPYYWEVYCKGNWGNKVLGGLFYKDFDLGRNTMVCKYNPDLAIHLTFDFNVNPYMSATVWQVEGGNIYNIDEIAMKSPQNTTASVCREFVSRYNTHSSGLFIYGDPSGMAEDTRSEEGFNDYYIIEKELAKYHPETRVAKKHPSVAGRGNFINALFRENFGGWSVWINEKSVYLKNDLLFGREHPDGGKLKEKATIDGVKGVEKYHHHSDGADYMLCELLSETYTDYQYGQVASSSFSYGYKPRNENRL